MLERAGIEHRVWTTERPHHATEITSHLPKDATVVALGGDGTVHEVGIACADTPRTLGIVPTGSGDDLAHALGLPRGRIEPAVDALIAGHTRLIDSGICNDERFVNAVGSGFDAEVGARVADAPPSLKDMAAYLWAVFATLREFELASVRVEADDALVYEGRSLLVSVQNGPRTGGSFRFAPNAALDDGYFDVVVAGRFTRMGTVAILPRVMLGRHLSHPQVHMARASHVRVSWSAPRVLHMEGEIRAAASELDVRMRPRSLRVIAPQAS